MKDPRIHARHKGASRGQKAHIDSFFRLGTIHVDSELKARLQGEGMRLEDFLERHGCGDSGEACAASQGMNLHVIKNCLSEDLKIKRGYIIISLYSLRDGEKFCIATKSQGRGTIAAFAFQMRPMMGRLGKWASKAIREALGK